MKYNGSYDWFKHSGTNSDGCYVSYYDDRYLFEIIKKNRFNQNPKRYSCPICKTVNELTGSYISFVEEEVFLTNPRDYINNAYDKSENDAEGYDLEKQR